MKRREVKEIHESSVLKAFKDLYESNGYVVEILSKPEPPDAIITVNGEEAIVINSETSNINQVTNYELSENDDYIVQLQTNSENTVISFKVIKRAPLNSIAIFLIIAGIFLVATLTFIFIRLRTKMRVS